LAFSTLSTNPLVCGATATGIHIQNSSTRGISVLGACNVVVSNFDINNTFAPGLYVSQDSGFRAPYNVKFTNGFVSNAGQLEDLGAYNATNPFGAEVLSASYVDFDNVTFLNNYGHGIYTSSSSYVTVNDSLVNTTGAGNGGAGMMITGCTHCAFNDDRIDTTYAQGWDTETSSDVNISNLVVRNASTNATAGSNRAFWNENDTGPITTNGLTVIDDQGTATGYILGDYNNGSYPAVTTGINSKISNGTFTIQNNGGSSTASVYTMANSLYGTVASVHQTAQTAAITTATLCASSGGACNVAGQYEINISMIQTGTACSSVTAGQVVPSITWTDTNGVTHSAVIPQLLQQTTATATAYASTGLHFETANANAGASGTFIISTNGSVIQYATAYTACTTGTGTYQIDIAVNRLQ
jgi:hypothetical protein